ncbi:MAG: methylated-DNA--[protein]-cysteine S-methyltransferase [Bacteroidota bacterium]
MAKDLYMVALVPPKKLVERLEEVRQEFASNYNCKAALKTPVHLTLVPPFQLDIEKETELVEALKAGEELNRFAVELKDYGYFMDNEVLFVSVKPSVELSVLQEAVKNWVHDGFEVSEKYHNHEEFNPHVTIGRKDIPKGRFADAVNEYSTLKFAAKFENKAFYLWRHDGKAWQIHTRFPLRPAPEPIIDVYHEYLESPLGWLKLVADDQSLIELAFMTEKPGEARPNAHTAQTVKQLQDYFAGDLKAFTVPMNPQGTAFQQKVWKLVSDVGFGQTQSYQAISRKYGDVKAIRAVGSANGKNPIPVIIPCHRVVGSNGNLVGYSGGLWRKEWLLAHEAKFGGQQSLF